MYKYINKIVKESIDKLLVEEFGLITSLEPFCDYLIERFFNKILDGCLNNPMYNDDVAVVIDMGWVKRNIQCSNWYGIDSLKYIILKTEKENSDVMAHVDCNENNLTAATIVINVFIGFNKDEFPYYFKMDGEKKMKRVFYSMYKESIMHELTHLIEVVNTKSNYRFPDYAAMNGYEDIKDVAFAFSKTENNAYVNTLYYSILNSRGLKELIYNWKGSRNKLLKNIIEETSEWNRVKKMRVCISMLENAINNGSKKDINFVRKLIDVYRGAASAGTKNTFKVKWSIDHDDVLTSWNDDDNNVIRIGKKIHKKMYDMYYDYIKKLYKVADLAVEMVKKT